MKSLTVILDRTHFAPRSASRNNHSRLAYRQAGSEYLTVSSDRFGSRIYATTTGIPVEIPDQERSVVSSLPRKVVNLSRFLFDSRRTPLRSVRAVRNDNGVLPRRLLRRSYDNREDALRFAPCLPDRQAGVLAMTGMTTRGSALLVTILLMAVLMIAGLGFHRLIVDSIRLSYDSVSAGKAYFHAEAGIEEALLRMESNLPGYEVTHEPGDSDDDGANDFQFSLKSLSSSASGSVPCDFDASDQPWGTLSLNESVTLPLFRDNAGGETAINQFRVEYQLPEWPFSGDFVDALSWKIFGMELTGGETSAMSGYFQVTKGAISSFDEISTANFYECTSGGSCIFYENYKIQDFLMNHRNNYLVLTNILNIQESDITNADNYAFSFRLMENGVPLVCDRVRIEADGALRDISGAGDRYRQNINAEMALDDFLPVFDFALYRTKE